MLSEFTRLGLFGIRAGQMNHTKEWYCNHLPNFTTQYLCMDGAGGRCRDWSELFSGNCVADDAFIDESIVRSLAFCGGMGWPPYSSDSSIPRDPAFDGPMGIFEGYGEIEDDSDRLYSEYIDSSAQMYQETHNLQP